MNWDFQFSFQSAQIKWPVRMPERSTVAVLLNWPGETLAMIIAPNEMGQIYARRSKAKWEARDAWRMTVHPFPIQLSHQRIRHPE